MSTENTTAATKDVWERHVVNHRLPITIMGKVASAAGVDAWDVVAKVHSHDFAEKTRRSRLIAAAPDMLDALRLAEQELTNAFRSMTEAGVCWADISAVREAHRAARAAIARATGGQS